MSILVAINPECTDKYLYKLLVFEKDTWTLLTGYNDAPVALVRKPAFLGLLQQSPARITARFPSSFCLEVAALMFDLTIQ